MRRNGPAVQKSDRFDSPLTMISFCKLIEDYKEESDPTLKRDLLTSYFCGCKEEELDSAVFILNGKKDKRIITEESLIRFVSEFSEQPIWLLNASIAEVGDVAEACALATGLPISPKDWDLSSLLEETASLQTRPDSARERLFFLWKTLPISEKTFLHSILLGKRTIKVPENLLFSALADCFDLELGILLTRYKTETPDLKAIPFSRILRSWFSEKKPGRLSKMEIAKRIDLSRAEPEDKPVYSGDSIPENYGYFLESPGIPIRVVGNSSGIFVWKESDEEDLLDPVLFPEVYSVCSGFLESGHTFVLTGILDENSNHKFIIYDILNFLGKNVRNLPFSERRNLLFSVTGETEKGEVELAKTLPLERETTVAEFYKFLMDKKSGARLFDPTGSALYIFTRPSRSFKAVLLYGRKGRNEIGTSFWELGFGLRTSSQDSAPQTIGRIVLQTEDPFFAELDFFFQENTIEKKGPIRGVPTIWKAELSFQNIRVSKRHKSGYRLEEIRLVRRIPEEQNIDSLETLQRFWKENS